MSGSQQRKPGARSPVTKRKPKSRDTRTDRFSVRTWPELAEKLGRWLTANPGVSLNQMTCMALDEFASKPHVLRPDGESKKANAESDDPASVDAQSAPSIGEVMSSLPTKEGLSLSKADVKAIARAVADEVSAGSRRARRR